MVKTVDIRTQQAKIAEHIALRWAMPIGLVSAFIALAWFLGVGVSTVPITGSTSMARVALLLIALTTLVCFSYFYRRGRVWLHDKTKQTLPKRWVFWRDTLTLAFAYTVLASAVAALTAYVLSNAFKELALDPYISSVFVGAAVGVSTYIIINQAYRVTINQIVAVLGIILVGGVLLAMVTNNQADWWQVHFSYLGMPESNTAKVFNFTLIFSGLVMLALTENLFNSLAPAIDKHQTDLKLNVIKSVFVLIALALAGVGLFPYVEGTYKATMHNLTASSLVLGFLFLIAALRWTSPKLSREFMIFSYSIAAALVGCYVGFIYFEYLNLTAFELSAFGLSFVWLAVYLKNLALIAEEA